MMLAGSRRLMPITTPLRLIEAGICDGYHFRHNHRNMHLTPPKAVFAKREAEP